MYVCIKLFIFFIDNSSTNSTYHQSAIGIQVSYWPSHQIITRIFAIFLREILNYRNIIILPIEFNGDHEEEYYDGKRITSTLDSLM